MRRRLVTAVATLALLSGIQVAASPPAAAVTVRGLNEKVWTNTDQQVRLRARIAIETNSSLTQGRYRLHLTCFGVNPFNGAWEQTTCTFYTDGPAFWYWRGFFGDVHYYSGSVSNSYEADGDKTWTGAWHAIDRSGDVLEYWVRVQDFRAYFDDSEYMSAYHSICSKYWSPQSDSTSGAAC